MSVYTRSGDKGTTGLLGKRRVVKDDVIIEACGTLDELSSYLGMVLSFSLEEIDVTLIEQIQHDLYLLMATLAGSTNQSKELFSRRVKSFESRIDTLTKELPPLNSFIYPRGDISSIWFHISRAVCRRAERRLVSCPSKFKSAMSYLNRLSDLLFMLSRYYNSSEKSVLLAEK